MDLWQTSLRRIARQKATAIKARADLKAETDGYQSDPIAFVSRKLQVQDFEGNWVPWTPWAKQAELIKSAWINTLTGCISGQKTGKSAGLAALAIAWCYLKPNGTVRLVGASEAVIKDSVWAEIRRLLLEAQTQIGPAPNLDPATGWKLSERQRIHAVTAKEKNRLAGKSGAEQLIIVDEACGLPDELWEVILGNLSGGGHLVWATNPTVTSGKPYEWSTRDRGGFNIVQIDSRENPNFSGQSIPGLQTPEGMKATILDIYGEESAEFDVRVRGRFPRQGSNSVISLQDIDDAQARWKPETANGALFVGVDVARFGDDDSCITFRRGFTILEQVVIHGANEIDLSGMVVRLTEERRQGNEPVQCNVEEDGLGQGVVDILTVSAPEWMTVNGVMVGAGALNPEQFTNRRSELWFAGQQWLDEGGALPSDKAPTASRLKEELVAPTYSFDSRLRRQVESKDSIKKRLKRSPDVADSFLISLAPITQKRSSKMTVNIVRW